MSKGKKVWGGLNFHIQVTYCILEMLHLDVCFLTSSLPQHVTLDLGQERVNLRQLVQAAIDSMSQ